MIFSPKLGDKWVHTFSRGISLKVKAIAQLEFELAYFEAAIKYFTCYTTKEVVCNFMNYRTPYILLHYHYSQVHPDSEYLYSLGSHL